MLVKPRNFRENFSLKQYEYMSHKFVGIKKKLSFSILNLSQNMHYNVFEKKLDKTLYL